MNLYHVQDSDRPLWVVATDWTDALDKWKAKIREENDGECDDEPQGIELICDADELLLPVGEVPATPANEWLTEARGLIMSMVADRWDGNPQRHKDDPVAERARQFLRDTNLPALVSGGEAKSNRVRGLVIMSALVNFIDWLDSLLVLEISEKKRGELVRQFLDAHQAGENYFMQAEQIADALAIPFAPESVASTEDDCANPFHNHGHSPCTPPVASTSALDNDLDPGGYYVASVGGTPADKSLTETFAACNGMPCTMPTHNHYPPESQACDADKN